MKKAHFYSGLTLSIFITAHLSNHLLSFLGEAAHITFMDELRVIYRNFAVEFVLIASVIIQIFTGISLFFRKRKIAKGFFELLQIWSGLYLAIFLIFHVSAVFAGRYLLNLDTNLYFGVAGLNTFPYYLFFAPYYGLSIIALFGHIAAIHALKMNKTMLGVTVQNQAIVVLIIGILLSVAVLYGLTNGFDGIEIPQAYHIMIGK